MEENKNTNVLVLPENTNTEEMDGIFGDAVDVNEEELNNIKSLTDAKSHKISPEQLYFMRNRKPYYREHKVGRNDPCPCGSGKKYKNCCLKTGEYEQLTTERK